MTTDLRQGSALQSRLGNDKTLMDFVLKTRPESPVYVVSPHVIKQSVKDFAKAFKGKALYAVKTNPDPAILETLKKSGIKAYDVASLEEIKAVRRICTKSELHFMHPVKKPEDIRAAYFDYGVRDFVLDHEEELFKIMRETDLAQDLNLTIRLALPKNESALIDFSGKFGATHDEALDLLQKCRPVSKRLGLSFHVGTQTTKVQTYVRAIRYCAKLIKKSGVTLDRLNIGGGFPVAYQDDTEISPIDGYMKAVNGALAENGLSKIALLAEPGRILVAQGVKLVTRVELRKGNLLYINDGVYGGLFDAAKWVGTRYPVSAISCDRPFAGKMQNFRLAGPTCDSLDMMDGPFTLPTDIGMGDWIVFDNAGAYSQALRSDFNGFGHAAVVCVSEGSGR